MNKIVMSAAAGLLAGCCCKECEIKEEAFGTTKFGEKASLYTIESAGGMKFVFSDFGGRLVKCYMPGRDGKVEDITLGWNTVGEYEKLGFSMGTLIGRYGNRIADGKFILEGKTYQLPVNETTPSPRNCNIHGGPDGWDSKVWKATKFVDGDKKGLELVYVSKDGENGFPGTVTMKVKYTVLPDNVWRIDYEATTDKTTVINPTHHSYWNLAGEASGSVISQNLQIFADSFTKTTAGLIPSKDMPVKDTGFDFTSSRPIKAKAEWMAAQEWLKCTDNWYDHNFVLRGKIGELKQAAEMYDEASGRVLEVWTTEPCMQVYGAQNMTDEMPAKAKGKKLCKFAGVALETQHYPDSPNHPEFPTTVLLPGQVFRSTTEYRFKTK